MTLHIETEIGQQAAAVRRVLQAAPDPWEAFARRVDTQATLVLLARGTSDNAARYARYALGIQAGRLTSMAMPSTVTLYGRRDLVRAPTGVVAISQSGQSPDLVHTLEAARDHGAPSLVITNDPTSPLAQVGDHVVDLACGPERSVAATKTYTATLAALVRLVRALGGPAVDSTALFDALEQAVAAPLPREATGLLTASDHVVVTSRGYNHATAHEAALKLQELTGRPAQPWSTADLAHGPVAALTATTCLVSVASGHSTHADGLRAISQAQDRGARTLAATDDPELGRHADAEIRLPAGLPEWLTPLVAIVPLQRLAVHAATAFGVDIDTPHGLTKITETR